MNDSNVVIRFAKEDDLSAIAEIEKECFSSPWSLNALKDFFVCDYSRIVVALCDDEIAGYVTFSVICDEVQISNVAVSKRFRRLHIGTLIIDKLIMTGREINCAVAFLEVRKSNLPAIELYKKCGFFVVGERKNFYSSPTENAILMNYTF